MLVIPPELSQEEEALQQKFNKLKKKKRALLGLKKPSSTASQRCAKRSLSGQRVADAATATEQAKQLVKSGAIRAIKAETKNSGFKRPRALERKLEDPEKGPVPTFLPFQRSPCAQGGVRESSRGPHRKSVRESSVSSRARLRDLGPAGERPRGPGAGGGPPRSFDWGYEKHGAPCSKVSPRRRLDRSRERNRDRSRERIRDLSCEQTMEPIRDWNRDPCHERNYDRSPKRNRDPSRKRNRGLSRERERDRDPKRDRDQDREGPFRRSDWFPERRDPWKGHTL